FEPGRSEKGSATNRQQDDESHLLASADHRRPYPAQQLEHEGEYQSLHWQARDEDAAQLAATISKQQSRAGAGRPARLLYLRTEPLYAAFFFGCAAVPSTPAALAIAPPTPRQSNPPTLFLKVRDEGCDGLQTRRLCAN